jgi:penicillin-binding protein 1A
MSEPDRPDIQPPAKPRLKRLRFLAILVAVLVLGLISFVFGVFVSIASDLPSLTKFSLYKNAESSVLLDDRGHELGVLSQQNRVIVTPKEIPKIVTEAVISIEDKRFETNSGVDIRGIVRALIQDVQHKGTVQGASTIEQQFIKNALQAQSHRTIFEKLREAALAYQLSHKWSKEKILTAYLNTIYFGDGAYGIESAAQTYFGQEVNHLGCGTPNHELCVQQLKPWEAALLAGIIQSPTEYNPVEHQEAARDRRDVVLYQMYQQGYLEKGIYEESVAQALPAPQDVQTPRKQPVEGVDVGYFTSWVEQQLVERYGPARTFDGGLKIETTLDLGLQREAERAVESYLPYGSDPTASLVAIENSTGEVRAMIGGRNYDETPFNIATEGERQPGSSFKVFDLAAALEDGISPSSVWSSKQKVFIVPHTGGKEKFTVHNDEGAYTGETTLTNATAYSDNSVYAEVGLKVTTRRIAALARRMGITTPISTNPAMTIGGLTVGVTPLDMAHAYETLAHGGRRVTGTLAEDGAPVGVQEVNAGSHTLPDGSHRDVNQVRTSEVLPPEIAQTETTMLETVLQYGTAKAAAIGQFAAGKTGTTSNYGDAWFIGWDKKYTVAVWVGYPNGLVPMTTQFNGGPVLGGTFPALIWRNFVLGAMQLEKAEAAQAAEKAALRKGGSGASGSAGATGEQTSGGEGSTGSPSGATSGGGSSSGGKSSGKGSHQTPAPSGGEGSSGGATGGKEPEHAAAPATPAPAGEAPAGASPPASPTGGVSPTG